METLHDLTYEGHTAWIRVDDRKLQVYTADIDHAKRIITCWMASEVGKTFEVGWQYNNSQVSLIGKLYLDGKSVRSRLAEHPGRGGCRIFSTLTISKTTEVPFMFSALELTDDDNYLEVNPSTENVSEIKLVTGSTDPVWKNCTEDCSTCVRRYRHQTPPVEKIHERSKKAIAHRIGFGNEQLRTSSFRQNSEKKKPLAHYHLKDHLMTFIFRYRPLDVLQANGIAPRIVMPSEKNGHSTSSQSSKGKRKAVDLKENVQDSVKNFEDREMALLAELNRLKDEKEQFLLAELEKLRKDKYSPNDVTPRKKVKKETKPLFPSGEVIDLT